MGAVYKARHQNDHIARARGSVAIKLIRSEYAQNPQYRTRFAHEAGIGIGLQHPNIAKGIDYHEDDHQLAFNLHEVQRDYIRRAVMTKWFYPKRLWFYPNREFSPPGAVSSVANKTSGVAQCWPGRK